MKRKCTNSKKCTRISKEATFPRKPVTIGIAGSLIQSPCNFLATAGYVASKISAFVKSSVVMKPISKASYCNEMQNISVIQ